MAVQKGLLCDNYVVEDKAIAIPLKRYNELIKKELFLDELTKDCSVIVSLNKLEVIERGEDK